MIAWILLLAAIACAAAAYAIGWPSWRDYRARDARDLNAERYLAWRGRAPRGQAAGSMREGPTMAERRRLGLAALLVVAAIACLVGFFVTT